MRFKQKFKSEVYTIMNKKKTHIVFLNFANLLACISLTAWYVFPSFRYNLNALTLLIILLVWILTLDFRWFYAKWTSDMYFVLVTALLWLPFLVSGQLRFGLIKPEQVFFNILLFFVPIFVTNYYLNFKKDIKVISRILKISLSLYLIGIIQTIIGLIQFPEASRFLSSTNQMFVVYHEKFLDLGIGGFGFVYMSAIVSLTLYFYFINSKKRFNINWVKENFLFITVFLGSTFLVIQASFTIALLSLVGGVFLLSFVRSTKQLLFLTILILLLYSLLPLHTYGNLVLSLAETFVDNDVLYVRLMDFGNSMLADASSELTSGRFEMYQESFNTFLKNPIFGKYGPLGNINLQTGGHSGLLDLAAMYGIYILIPYFMIFALNFKRNYVNSSSKFKILHITIYSIILVLAFINPMVYISEFGFVIFLFIPLIQYKCADNIA